MITLPFETKKSLPKGKLEEIVNILFLQKQSLQLIYPISGKELAPSLWV